MSERNTSSSIGLSFNSNNSLILLFFLEYVIISLVEQNSKHFKILCKYLHKNKTWQYIKPSYISQGAKKILFQIL